jgi:iron complex outermembrane receptor protein
MAIRLSWAIVAGVSLAPAALHAADRDIFIDLPAATLAQSIAALSTQAGVSIGTEGALPYLRTPDVRGRMSVARALDKLLAGTAWRARRVSPTAYRIVARHHDKPAPPPTAAPDYPYPSPIPDVVVTARKIAEPESSLPGPVAVYVPARADRSGAGAGARTVARTPGPMPAGCSSAVSPTRRSAAMASRRSASRSTRRARPSMRPTPICGWSMSRASNC